MNTYLASFLRCDGSRNHFSGSEEEDDEENEPPPKRKKAPSKKKADDDDDDEEEDEDDDDFSEEESPVKKGRGAAAKRKNDGGPKSKAKIQKVSADSSEKNAAISKTVDTSGFFYRYTCQWMVKISSAPHPIKCKRKFTKMNEAKEHLIGHHINRLVMNEQPLKCGWEGCDDEQVHSDAEGLKEHAPVHAESQ